MEIGRCSYYKRNVVLPFLKELWLLELKALMPNTLGLQLLRPEYFGLID
jgi:hypothetical protein